MKDGFRLYDTHAHLGSARHSGRSHDAAMLLRTMDAAGIDRALLIPFPVVDEERAEHDRIAAAVLDHPERFSGAACLAPLQDAAKLRDELRRCREELGFRALKLQPQYHGLNPLGLQGGLYFEEAARAGMTLVVHTGSGAPFALPSLYIPAAQRFPEIPFVLGHAGGSVYYLEAVVAALVCPNVFIEVSSLMPHHVMEVLGHVPAGRLLAGSDLPESAAVEMHKVLALEIPDSEKRRILWETPVSLFDAP